MKTIILLFVLFSTLFFAQCPDNTGTWTLSSGNTTINTNCNNAISGVINVMSTADFFIQNCNFKNYGLINLYDTTSAFVINQSSVFDNYSQFNILTYTTYIQFQFSNATFNNHIDGILKNQGFFYSYNGTFNNEGTFNNLNKIFLTQSAIINNKSGGNFINNTTASSVGTLNFSGKFHNFMGGSLANISNAIFETQITNEGTVNNSAIFRCTDNSTNSNTIYNNAGANFNITCYTCTFTNSQFFYNFGNLTIDNYNTLINTGIINDYNGGSTTNNGTFVNNGSYTQEPSHTVTNNGIWKGTNTVHHGNFTNIGTLSPGNSVGTYTFNNNYTHQNTATANFEIGGTTDYDKVTAGSNIDLQGGTLNLNFVNGYTPTSDEQYTIMTATSGVTGTFATVNFPSGYTDHMYVTYNPNSVVVNYSTTVLATQEAKRQEFQLFPNPANTKFQLKTPTNFKFNTLKIVDESGKLIKQFAAPQEYYDVSYFPEGVYYIVLEGSETQKLKLIKN